MEIFLIEAGIISAGVNVIFDDKVKEMLYDLEDTPDKLGINED